MNDWRLPIKHSLTENQPLTVKFQASSGGGGIKPIWPRRSPRGGAVTNLRPLTEAACFNWPAGE